MIISPRLDGVTGSFDTETGKLVCVSNPKYGDVQLCFVSGMNISFGNIRLHSSDRFADATAVMPDAQALGTEIAKRWNEYPALQERERQCPTMQEGESRALLRCLQECAGLLGLGLDASPAEVIAAVRHEVGK